MMRKILLISFWLLFLCLCSAAQEQITGCPSVSVSGPAGIVEPGGIATFIVRMDARVKAYKPSYKWSVSAGEIIRGQGTPQIGVLVPDSAFTATVDVGGLPDGCTSTFSEMMAGDPMPQAIKLDEILGPINRAAKERLDHIRKAFAADTNSQCYVLLRFHRGRSSSLGSRRDELVRTISKEEDRRITFVDVPDVRDVTEIWLIPAGTTPPKP